MESIQKNSEYISDFGTEENSDGVFKTAKQIADLFYQLIDLYKSDYIFNPPVELLQFSHLEQTLSKLNIESQEIADKLFLIQKKFLKELSDLDFYTLNKFLFNEEQKSPKSCKGPSKKNHKPDNRFAFHEWTDNPYFDYYKKFYYLFAKYALKWLNSFKTIDKKTKDQLHYYLKNFLDFMSPANLIITNPEVIEATALSSGENFLNGFKNYLIDLLQNKGRFYIRTSNLKAFKVGKNVAITKGKVIFQNDLMQLIQYMPTTESVFESPLMIIPPWINKYYILDLSPENSLVKWLVDQGYTVYMISWVNPGKELAHKQFEDYMLEGPLQALDVITKNTKTNSVHALGYCIGGTLLGCTLSYLKKKKDNRIISATYLMTLLDFTYPGELGVFIDKPQLDALDRLMQDKGFLNGRLLEMTFNSLRPNDLIWPYFIKQYLLGENPKPFDLLFWNSDSTNQPHKMYSYYLRNMYLHNRLRKPNKIVLNGVPIDIRDITIPAFFVSSETDHISLWKSVYKGIHLHSGPVRFILSAAGHVKGVINPPQQQKYHYRLNPSIHDTEPYPKHAKDWLEGTVEHPGSWWPYWALWLKNINPNQVPARVPMVKGIRILEDAPGSYVQKKI